MSQRQRRVASHERVPVAVAPALIAPIMHCMHIAPERVAGRREALRQTRERPKSARQTPVRVRPLPLVAVATSRSMSRR